jgi:adenosylcobinamide-phosphate synthase
MLFSTPPSPFFLHPLLLLIGALLLDATVGDMPRLFRLVPHPVVLVGRAIAWLDIRLNREQRSERARFIRGILAVVILILAAAVLGAAIQVLCGVVPFGGLIEVIVITVLLAQRSLFDRVRDVAVALDDHGLAGGRKAVAHIVGRDPASLDVYGVARAGIESLAENFSDGVVAPVFWTLLLGLPGLFVYKTANTLDSMIGHLTPRYRSFGWAAARFDDVLNLIPARLSGVLIALAAAVAPQARGVPALKIMLRDAGKHRSPNSGWPEAAMAGGLDLALAGPRRYGGAVVADPWLGDGKARATPLDMQRALSVFAIACMLQGIAVALLWLVLVLVH